MSGGGETSRAGGKRARRGHRSGPSVPQRDQELYRPSHRLLDYYEPKIPITPETDRELVMGDANIPHSLLRFAITSREGELCSRLRRKHLLRHHSFDWTLLEVLGQADRLRGLIDGRWADALACDNPQYEELTYEFFATFRHQTGSFDEANAVSFSLGRQYWEMTVPGFAVLTGLYGVDEVTQPAFRESLRGVHAHDREGWIKDSVLVEFWEQGFGDGEHSSSVVESSIRDPVYRYLHRIIAYTLVGRNSGHEKCSNLDLFCLYCIISRREANLATILLSSLSRGIRTEAASVRIPCGPYITRIAENLGVFHRYPIDFLTPGPPTTPWGLEDAQKASIITRDLVPRWMDIRPQRPINVVPHADMPSQPARRQRRRDQPQPAPITLEAIYAGIQGIQMQLGDLRDDMRRHRGHTRGLYNHFAIPLPDDLIEPEPHGDDDSE